MSLAALVDRPPVTARGVPPRWAYRSPALQGLSLRFAVRCTDRRLGRYLGSLLAPLEVDGTTGRWYSLVSRPAGTVDISFQGEWVACLDDARAATSWLLRDVNRAVVEASGQQQLLLHAGGVQSGDVGVLLPAPSGSGKSTLTAALVEAGVAYLSDEVLALSLPEGRIVPFPKPLTIKAGGAAALKALGTGLTATLECCPPGRTGGERQVRVSDFPRGTVGRGCAVGAVIRPRYVAGARTALHPLSQTEAFAALAANTVNFAALGSRGVPLLAGVVEHCRAFELVMSDPGRARQLVLQLLGELEGSSCRP